MENDNELTSPTLSLTVAQARRSLTPRDIQVAQMTALGIERNDIAGRLSLSRSAVNRHMAKMFKLTGAVNGANLVSILTARGILGSGGGRVSFQDQAPGDKAARIVRRNMMEVPLGEVEEHVNAVLEGVAQQLESDL